MGNTNWKPFGSNNSGQQKNENQSKESQKVDEKTTTEEPKIVMTPSEIEALLEKKLEEKLQNTSKPEPVQEKVITQIKNTNTDDIPELRNFVPKERIYVLTNGTKPISHGLQTRHKPGSPLQYINPETQEVHALFYSLTETSFFKDKHKGDARVEHVHFKDGMLKTYEQDIKLQKFLAIHPGNKAMGGTLFEEYNPSKEAETTLEQEELLFKAMEVSRSISFVKLDAVARLLCSDYKETWEPAEVKKAVYLEVKKQPTNFLKLANDPVLEMKGIAKTAVDRGLITYKNYRFLNDKGEVICEVSRNQDEYDAICEYFLTGNGRTTYEFLRNAIS